MKKGVVCLLVVLFTLSFSLPAQVDTIAITPSDKQTDNVKPPGKHSPTAAVLLSIIPGGGQIYNKKWWKVPIIYAGLSASSYCIYHYGKLTKRFQLEYRYRVSTDTTLHKLCDMSLADKSNEVILSTKNAYQRSFEIAIAATVIIYVLNLVDALVDAHLFNFDISDNLSLRIAPTLLPDIRTGLYAPGITVCLRF
jgi:hypothetical protein